MSRYAAQNSLLRMQVPNMQVRTYVHGTLYSLLCRPAIREQAHQSGLADSLRAVSATSEPVFQRHIAHILERLEDEDACEQLSEDEDEEDDVDGMEYEDEYDEMEEVLSSGAVVSFFCAFRAHFVRSCAV